MTTNPDPVLMLGPLTFAAVFTVPHVLIDVFGRPDPWGWLVGLVVGMFAPAVLFVAAINVWYRGKTFLLWWKGRNINGS